jgi:hypothetical protein
MNAIVFVLQGCPLAKIGAYGNEWVVTPHLDQLAAEGIVLDQHISDCPEPIQARRAWRSGRFPWFRSSAEVSQGDGGADLLACLKAAGVKTILLNHNRPCHPLPAEFLLGWDEIHTVPPVDEDESPADALLRHLPAILASLPNGSPWLLWIETDRFLPPWHVPKTVFRLYLENLLDDDDEPETSAAVDAGNDEHSSRDGTATDTREDDGSESDGHPVTEAQIPETDAEEGQSGHDGEEDSSLADIEPWTDPPEGWFDADDLASWELLHRSFDSAITSWDADFGRVMQLLKSSGLDQSAHWLLTSDYGFPLGEHGIIGRFRPWLHEERVHLPCMIRLAGAAEAGRRIPTLTQPVDLMPTLAGWLGVAEIPGDRDGIDLMPLLHGKRSAIRTEAITILSEETGEEWAIRTADWAYLLPRSQNPAEDDEVRSPQLYAKPADRWERNNLSSRELSRSEAFAERLQTIIVSPPSSGKRTTS